MNFAEFFTQATGHTPGPYEYQKRLACGEKRPGETEETWLAHGTPCQSRLINIPTGLGKTAAVVLAWLWNRVHHSPAPGPQNRPPAPRSQPPDPLSAWPRRLVYCLPMRTLVEQTAENVSAWLDQAGDLEWKPGTPRAGKVGVHILIGGEDAGEWDIYPEENAILIGTQDMLLSRALNRGYGMSRYRWPMHFGLLNNDCLWVMDEMQLMGVGVETSAQLDGFRHDAKMPTLGACPTWWMSATLEPTRLATVDHPTPADGWLTEKLSQAEQSSGRPRELVTAAKKLSPAPIVLNATTKAGYAKQVAAFIKDRHQSGTFTLVVVNRVSRAREIYEALATGKRPLYAPDRVALIHSRFRPVDRERHTQLLFGEGDRIVIATQAVEAGVDVSARLLITELAPWSSLVQRMGRCNRYADAPYAEVLWVDIALKDEKDDLRLPYTKAELDKTRDALTSITDASAQTLRGVTVPEDRIIRPVLRRRDLVDLFDTTPDLCGQDLDISRYIRDGDDNDVQFFWRRVEGEAPYPDEPDPQRQELCRVAIGDAVKFLAKKPRAWRWNPLDEAWQSTHRAMAGGLYLVDVQSGGYADATGWTGDPKDIPSPLPPATTEAAEGYSRDPDTFARSWQTLVEHTRSVVAATDALAAAIAPGFENVLHHGALWHDLGKAHDEFQTMLRKGDPAREGVLWAKSEHRGGRCRSGFRHELASAIAWLLAGPQDIPERDLVGYLIAAHHGKVRLSIRSLPNETPPDQPMPDGSDRLFARGIWQGEKLQPVTLNGMTTPEIQLDLSFMKMGDGPQGPSWLARTVALRDRLGPFRLAFLETLLRAADARASRIPAGSVGSNTAHDVSPGLILREEPLAYGQPALSADQQSLVADLVADGLSIQARFKPEPLYKQTGQGHYAADTVNEIRQAREQRPPDDAP